MFEDRALKLQDALYEEAEKSCMDLMITSQRVWGMTVTPMFCARDNNMIDVIGHPCIQRHLNRIWYNDIPISDMSEVPSVKWTDWAMVRS